MEEKAREASIWSGQDRKPSIQQPRRIALRVLLIGLLTLLAVGRSHEIGLAQVNNVRFAFTGSSYVANTSLFNQGANQSQLFANSQKGYGIKAGPFRLFPSLGYGIAYSDNIFALHDNKKSDLVHLVAPALQAHLPILGKHSFVASYAATRMFYDKYSQGNNGTLQNMQGQLNLNFPSRLGVNLQVGQIAGFDPRGSELDIQSADITKWNVNTVLGQAQYRGNYGGVGLQLRSSRWNFTNNGQDLTRNRLDNYGSVNFYGALTPKTSLGLGAGVSETIYETNKQLNSFSYNIYAGLNLGATGKTSGQIQVGYGVLNFDRAPMTPADPRLATGGNGAQFLNIYGAINWNATSKIRVTLRPFRNIQQAAPTVVGTTNGNVGGSFFKRTGFRLQVRHQTTRRFSTMLFYYYFNNQFSDEITVNGVTGKRTDNLQSMGIRFQYKTRMWLGFWVEYIYRNRTSTFDQFEYSSNTIMASVQLAVF